LQAGLRELLDDPARAARLAKAARERFLKEFTLDAMTQALRPLFEQAVASGAARTV
jgi:glycosyltransferase involved in cell wall biosynthesis